MDSFTYTITSTVNIVNGVNVDNHANLVNTQLIIPSKYRFFECRVKSFIINTISISGNTDFIYLVSTNFASDGFINSANTGTQYICFCDSNSGINNNINTKFYVENPNGKIITFYLRDDFWNNIPDARINNTRDTHWMLTVEFTPVDGEHLDKHKLRNGL